MADWLLDPFAAGLTQRALAEVVALGLVCGPLGVWVLLYRQSYAAESISHGMLPGLVLAALVGAPLVLGAAAGILLAAGAITLAARDERLGGDVAVAVSVTGLVGLGALLALSPEVPPRLQELLFGDLLGVTGTDLAVAVGLVGGLSVLLLVMHRPLALVGFDRAAAPSLNARPAVVELVLLVALGGATVAAVQGLGNLLGLALILAPAAAALNLVERLPAALALSGALAGLSGLLGLLASYHLEIAAGAAVALSAVSIFALTITFQPARRKGVLLGMKTLSLIVTTAAMALVPAYAMAEDTAPSPKSSASAACKAERAQMGEATFKQTYGTNKNRSNAFGKCVSKRTKTESANQSSASKACKAEQADPNFAASHGGKTFDQYYATNKKGTNGFGKCVSSKSKTETTADTKANVNAAKKCKADRKADAAAFAAKWGTKRNAFGKCVSATAKESNNS